MADIKYYALVAVSIGLFGCAALVDAPSRYENGQALALSTPTRVIEPDPHYAMPNGPVQTFTAKTLLPPQVAS
jgi:hypothetical protein